MLVKKINLRWHANIYKSVLGLYKDYFFLNSWVQFHCLILHWQSAFFHQWRILICGRDESWSQPCTYCLVRWLKRRLVDKVFLSFALCLSHCLQISPTHRVKVPPWLTNHHGRLHGGGKEHKRQTERLKMRLWCLGEAESERQRQEPKKERKGWWCIWNSLRWWIYILSVFCHVCNSETNRTREERWDPANYSLVDWEFPAANCEKKNKKKTNKQKKS